MEMLLSYENSVSLFPDLEKMGDLLYFDGPVLSLFKNLKNQLFLFYWVDSDESTNRWLVWKIEDDVFYSYLNRDLSLYDLIQSTGDNLLFAADIDNNAIYRAFTPLQLWNIPEKYLPAEDSYYFVMLPDFANAFIRKYEDEKHLYRILQREKSLTFNIKPVNKQFLDAVSATDASTFLARLSKSLLGYIEESFWSTFKDSVSSATEYNKLLSRIKDLLTPRLYNLRYGSFEVEIGVDLIHKVNLENFAEWQRGVINSYKHDVVDVDYNNPEDLKIITEKYSLEAREKIYEPYIKIINSSDYKLSVKDKKNRVVREYSKIDKIHEQLIVPPKKALVDDTPKEKKFINIVLEIQEGQDISDLSKRAIQSGVLFAQQLDDVSLSLNQLLDDGKIVGFVQPIEYTLSYKNGKYGIYVNELGLYLEDSDKDSLNKTFERELLGMITKLDQLEENDPTRDYLERKLGRRN